MLRPWIGASWAAAKNQMGEDWVVDSLLGYLQSSVWRSPVDKFIEQNCAGEFSAYFLKVA